MFIKSIKKVSKFSWQVQNLWGQTEHKLRFLVNDSYHFRDHTKTRSDRQGKRFHTDIKEIETRFLGRCDISLMVDSCWSLVKEGPAVLHSRATKKFKFRLWKHKDLSYLKNVLFGLMLLLPHYAFLLTQIRFEK